MGLSRSIVQGMMGAYYLMGVDIIKFDDDNSTLYISLPKESHEYMSNPNQIFTVHTFANRIKQTLSEMTKKEIKIKYKIRDEYWTKEMGEANYQKHKNNICAI